MNSIRAKEFEQLAALPTFSRSTTLQWIVPVTAAASAVHEPDNVDLTQSPSDDLPDPLSLGPAGAWSWNRIRDDLTDSILDPSLSTLFGYNEAGGNDATAPASRRIRRYELWNSDPRPWAQGHRPMFDVAGSGRSIEPQICAVRLVVTGAPPAVGTEAERGEPTLAEGYLTILLRVPAHHLPPNEPKYNASNGGPGQSWTVEDVLRLNWALVGRAALRTTESEKEKVWGRQTYKAWTVHPVGKDAGEDSEAGVPWSAFVTRMLTLPVEGFPHGFALDLHQIPTCLSSVVLPGAERPDAVLVAHHLGELLQGFDEENLPYVDGSGRDDPVAADARLMERSHGVVQYVTQRCSGLVICAPPSVPDEEILAADGESPGPSSSTYRRWVIANEVWKYWNYALFLVLHQRRQLGYILDELSDLEIPLGSSDTPPEERQQELKSAIARLSAAEQAFYQVQAVFRYRVISRKFGLQNFYEHCFAELRLETLYNDVEQILSGIARVVQRQLESVSNELEAEQTRQSRVDAARETRFERGINVGGAVFGVIALLVGVLSINIRQITSSTEGLTLGSVLLLILPVVAIGVAIVLFVLRRHSGKVNEHLRDP